MVAPSSQKATTRKGDPISSSEVTQPTVKTRELRWRRSVESNILALGTAVAIAIVVGGLALVWMLIYDVVSHSPVVKKIGDGCATVCCACDL